MRLRRVLRAASLALLGAGCAYDTSGLGERFPELARHEPHGLREAHPYVLPAAGQVALFTCVWPSDAPIPVGLPLDATPAERGALEAALTAWQRSGLGLRFLPVEAADAPIRIVLEDAAVAIGGLRDLGNAVVDCRIAPLSEQPASGPVRGAALVSATLRISRQSAPDSRGRGRALRPDELAGTALHELGHALGLQGHASRGTVVTQDVERVRRAGAAALGGEPLEDRTLRALYALPSGTALSRTPVDAWRTDLVDRMGRLAEREGLDGPFVRVGETAGRIFWRSADGVEYGLAIPKLRLVLQEPRKLLVLPEARTRRALPREGDRGPGASPRRQPAGAP